MVERVNTLVLRTSVDIDVARLMEQKEVGKDPYAHLHRPTFGNGYVSYGDTKVYFYAKKEGQPTEEEFMTAFCEAVKRHDEGSKVYNSVISRASKFLKTVGEGQWPSDLSPSD